MNTEMCPKHQVNLTLTLLRSKQIYRLINQLLKLHQLTFLSDNNREITNK